MAVTVGFGKIGSLSIPAGASRSFRWNHHPKMPSYWAQPQEVDAGGFYPGAISCEITGVKVHIQPENRFVEVTVKNTGSFDWGFDLFQSYLVG